MEEEKKSSELKIHPSHEELHSHVNPHIHHNEVQPELYQIPIEHSKEPALKSRFRLDWIYTKIRVKGFHPFPLLAMLFLALTLVPIVLVALGIRIPFTIVDLPFMKAIMDYLGIYSHKDLLVISTWVYWWPIFIATIFVFKRLWCGGFCPFGLMTDVGNFFGLKIRNGEEAKPINIIKYIFIGFFIFKALGYLHDAIGITNSFVLTLEFLIFFAVFSFVIGMIAPRRTFCRVFCFLGALPHLFGRLSIYTLETDRSKCSVCVGKWCQTGYKAEPIGIATAKEPLINLDGCPMYINIPQLSHTESNRNCILCGNCIKNCPYDAIHYKAKVPGYELYKGIDLNFHETIFVLGLIPLLATFIAMEGTLLTRYATYFNFPITAHWAITGSFYLLMILATAVMYFFIVGVGSMILDVKHSLVLRNFGYIFLPFAYMTMIRDITITYFFKGSFIPIKFPGFVASYPFIDIALVLIGAAWSIYMAKRITEVTMKQGRRKLNMKKVWINTSVNAVAIIGLAVYWISMVTPEYISSLAGFGMSYSSPFVLSAFLIGGFIIVVSVINIRKHVVAN